ncbi:hypothetical protein J2Y69_001864 [Microbacterium resistens]|uniref:PqqD family protein n=1 Tax=Microbacterium resistens TaxID=156977 RepID=A0ABU1SEB7_9MICO|nr:PqqD family protein [Microbacterium resistens]MDR6867263.1 hypothetical protein [Microbacterium resistens]
MRIGDDVAWTQSDQRIVALDLSRPDATPLVLEGTAAFVWEEIALEGPLTVEALVENIAVAFELPSDQIRQDVEGVIARLREDALVDG